ncbi:hypothetical protein GGD68_008776 [Paraburkholderia fungorum]|nr:hypothetical protein [Paraburkholderia fungorum]
MWIDDETAVSAGTELIKTRGPFRRVWALVEAEDEQHSANVGETGRA